MVHMQPVDITLTHGRGGTEKANDARFTGFGSWLYRWNSADYRNIKRGADMGERNGARRVAGNGNQTRPVTFDKAAK
jgi:hypothetical protein